MAKDAELDRLNDVQQRAYEQKQTAHKAQQSAWDRKKSTGDALHAAFEEKDRAYVAQQSSWENLQRLRDSYGPRIEHLNTSQEKAFRNMGAAFDSASNAHDRHDGASAKMYAEQGHTYKAESKGYVEERRRLVDELRSAAARHQPYVTAFQVAKEHFSTAKHNYEAAKAAHERAMKEYRTAKAAFDTASKAFQARLAIVKAENAKKTKDKRSIAERAGVPYAHRDNVYTKTDPDGTIQIYFGGVGEPNGPGHGHYTMDRSGKVTYKRDPFDPHGQQNFEGPGKDGHRGGFLKSQHGWIDNYPVTFALGWGTKQGHTLIADGHLSQDHFRDSRHHDHYGPGEGPNSNGTLRRQYTGPGA